MKKLLILIASAMVITAAGCTSSSEEAAPTVSPTPEHFTVFVDTELSAAMNDVASYYQTKHPEISITFNAEDTSLLLMRIKNGENADMIFTDTAEAADELDADGYIISSTIKHMFKVKPAAIKGKNSKTEIEDLNGVVNAESIAAIAPTNETTPLGGYTKQITDALGIPENRIHIYNSTEEIINAVSEGTDEIGFVFANDAALNSELVKKIETAPDKMLGEIPVYSAAITKNAESDAGKEDAVRDFYAYLSTNGTRNSFNAYGFTVQ